MIRYKINLKINLKIFEKCIDKSKKDDYNIDINKQRNF